MTKLHSMLFFAGLVRSLFVVIRRYSFVRLAACFLTERERSSSL